MTYTKDYNIKLVLWSWREVKQSTLNSMIVGIMQRIVKTTTQTPTHPTIRNILKSQLKKLVNTIQQQ